MINKTYQFIIHDSKKWLSLLCGLILALTVASANAAIGPNNSWISLSGTVVSASDNSFRLDYGPDTITVEMDDWDWYKEGKLIIDGDKVTVYGRVDDDVYERKKIEAGSVYVEGLNTFFYASAADEEDSYYYYPYALTYPVITEPWVELTGTITKVSGREFTLDTGNRKIKVDTIQMSYNPMDEFGFQKLKKGDRVRVSGNMDYDLFEKREVMADMIITLVKDKTKKQS